MEQGETERGRFDEERPAPEYVEWRREHEHEGEPAAQPVHTQRTQDREQRPQRPVEKQQADGPAGLFQWGVQQPGQAGNDSLIDRGLHRDGPRWTENWGFVRKLETVGQKLGSRQGGLALPESMGVQQRVIPPPQRVGRVESDADTQGQRHQGLNRVGPDGLKPTPGSMEQRWHPGWIHVCCPAGVMLTWRPAAVRTTMAKSNIVVAFLAERLGAYPSCP